MRPGFLNTCLVSLYFLIASAASPRDKYNEHLPEVVKSVSPDLSKEPTCEELRAMWRFSKRQSRAAESTNEIPTYRDPFAYNVWEDHASVRSVGGRKIQRPYIYGRLVHNIQRPRIPENTPDRIKSYEEVIKMITSSAHNLKPHNRRKPTSIRLVGGNNGLTQMHLNAQQTGSFQHLKELIQSERARELHEQKMSEENAREGALQYQRMMQDQNTAGYVVRDRDRDRDRDDLNFKTGRSRGAMEGVVSFPDVLAPSKYDSDYYYLQRSYPDTLVSTHLLLQLFHSSCYLLLKLTLIE
ncbi:hypothetical protein J6590_074282 [Homalodisca vitripennis]|nr:hypothetical protein J6590_074282 [Homalodisca vitripennis]